MSRPVHQLHTIAQWEALDPGVRSVILGHIRLKDRLQKWRREKEQQRGGPLSEPKWVPCRNCDKAGWVLVEPRYPGIHPSQLPQPCLLKVWFEMNGKEGRSGHEARTLFIFDIGHAIHHMLQTYGQQGAWGEHYEPEVKINGEKQAISEELFLEGSMDADNILVIDDIPNCETIFEVGVVHEYKTIKQENFNKLSRPKPEHREQAMIYARVQDRPVVVFLYVNKNDGNMTDYPVAFDRNIWNTVEQKARTLVQHYDAGQPPPADPGYHCQQCQYAFDCPAYAAYSRQRTGTRR